MSSVVLLLIKIQVLIGNYISDRMKALKFDTWQTFKLPQFFEQKNNTRTSSCITTSNAKNKNVHSPDCCP